jgi:hypothetical protein
VTYDIAITETEDGASMVHKADCPEVREAYTHGRRHAIYSDVNDETLPPDVPRHECLKGSGDDAA